MPPSRYSVCPVTNDEAGEMKIRIVLRLRDPA
jgi:hypothetical protein